MLLDTLTFYLIAAGLSFLISLIMLAFARMQSGTLATRSCAGALMIFAVAFLCSGFGPALPRWMTVMGTNMLFIAAPVLMHTGFTAYCLEREPVPDWFGWAVVAATALPFWYWGLVEPNGYYRSAMHSLATFAVVVRTTHVAITTARHNPDNLPLRAISVIFAVCSLWMALRFVLLIVGDQPLPENRGTNPTTWLTVFWYIVLMSVTAIVIMWLDANRKNQTAVGTGNQPGQGDLLQKRMMLLRVGTVILILAVVSELGIAYTSFLNDERRHLATSARLANDAFVAQSVRVIREVDTLIRAVRSHYVLTPSLAEAGRFIKSLEIDQMSVDDIFVIDAEGMIIAPESTRDFRRNVSASDYFSFHRDHSADEIFITPVDRGSIGENNKFYISRRITHPNGSFAGVVAAPLKPNFFTDYYRTFLSDTETIAELIGTDRRLRARVPEADEATWQRQIESPLWAELERSNSGRFHGRSSVIGIERTFFYQRVNGLPLVMITAYSDRDATRAALSKLHVIVPGGLLAVTFIIFLAGILTVVLRQRDEQDRFLSMLSHELKTPLSVIHMTLGSLNIAPDVRARVIRAVGAMRRVIERCLQADRLRQGRVTASQQVIRIEVDLAAICADSSAPERCVLQSGTLPSCATDVQLFRVIVSNLIDNALQYGALNRPVEISASAAEQRQRPGIRIDVSNAPGAGGVPDPKRVFRKYYRGVAATSKTGSGLGLHIAEGFARKLGGSLTYQPTGDRVKFSLWIPL